MIDAHLHFWQIDRGDYSWLDYAHEALRRNFLPSDFRLLRADAGVTQAILVQAAPTYAETQFLLDIAAREPWIRGVVGWVDLESAHAVAELETLARDPLLRGVRPMAQDVADPDWLLTPRFAPVFDAIMALGLRFDALVRADQLNALRRLLDRHPQLPVVLDHGGKPAIARSGWEPWASDLARLAERPLVCCKLSGLLTEAAPDAGADSIRRYIDHLVRCFGWERLIWGSDWPVLTLNGDYVSWVATARSLVPSDWRTRVFGSNAIQFYR